MSLVPHEPQPEGALKECLQEHCFHAFDALYCSLLSAEHIQPQFPDDKWSALPQLAFPAPDPLL